MARCPTSTDPAENRLQALKAEIIQLIKKHAVRVDCPLAGTGQCPAQPQPQRQPRRARRC